MADDPPRRRSTPRDYGSRLPRPSEPDLFEVFEEWLRRYRQEERDGITLRALYESLESDREERRRLTASLEALAEKTDNLSTKVGDHEVLDAARMSKIETALDWMARTRSFGPGIDPGGTLTGLGPAMGPMTIPTPPPGTLTPVPLPPAPPVVERKGFLGRLGDIGASFAEKLLPQLIPIIVAAVSGWLAARGCAGH